MRNDMHTAWTVSNVPRRLCQRSALEWPRKHEAISWAGMQGSDSGSSGDTGKSNRTTAGAEDKRSPANFACMTAELKRAVRLQLYCAIAARGFPKQLAVELTKNLTNHERKKNVSEVRPEHRQNTQR
eukprot:6208760-Pleurochrysis_carterae.AAC.3